MYRNIMETIINHWNWVVDWNFVTKPWITVMNTHDWLTLEGSELLQKLWISTEQWTWLALSEFNARLTYLAFNDIWPSELYHNKMIDSLKHLSPYSLPTPQVLVSWCSIETSLELVAHVEAKIARLTSSKTLAMSEPLYRVQGTMEDMDMQKNIINKYLDMRSNEETLLPTEFLNMTQPSCKATALAIGMNPKDWHRTIKSRFSPTWVETEVREVIEIIRERLSPYYTPLIWSRFLLT